MGGGTKPNECQHTLTHDNTIVMLLQVTQLEAFIELISK